MNLVGCSSENREWLIPGNKVLPFPKRPAGTTPKGVSRLLAASVMSSYWV
jgi:hypothetical protein